MKCPQCGKLEDRVLESRSNSSGLSVRRRRQCLECGFRFTSYEQIENLPLMVIKRNNKKEEFKRIKIENGIKHALRKRPIGSMALNRFIDDIELEIRQKAKIAGDEVKSTDLGDLIMAHLFKLDKVAYVRFASVYHHFDSAEEFVYIIKEMDR